MAAPSFKSFGGIASSTGVDVTVTIPTFAQDDICLILGWVRDVLNTVTITGFTQIATWDRGTTSRYWLFGRRMQTGDSTSAVFDKSGTSADTFAIAILYQGAIVTETAWEVVGTPSTGTADPSVVNGITTLTDDSLVVCACGGEDNNNASIITSGTDPADYAEHYDEAPTGADGCVTFSEAARSGTGATGDVSVNWNVAVPVGFGGIVIALKPVPVALLDDDRWTPPLPWPPDLPVSVW